MPKQSIKLQSGQKFNRLTVIRLDHIKEYIESMGANIIENIIFVNVNVEMNVLFQNSLF